jgi:CDGSH-type Zn-finger protein
MPSDPQVVTVLKVSEFPKLNLPRGKKAVYCRCWKSGTFPLCDAAHVKHNKETGDKWGARPLICFPVHDAPDLLPSVLSRTRNWGSARECSVGPLILDNDAYECSVDEECLIDEGDAK